MPENTAEEEEFLDRYIKTLTKMTVVNLTDKVFAPQLRRLCKLARMSKKDTDDMLRRHREALLGPHR